MASLRCFTPLGLLALALVCAPTAQAGLFSAVRRGECGRLHHCVIWNLAEFAFIFCLPHTIAPSVAHKHVHACSPVHKRTIGLWHKSCPRCSFRWPCSEVPLRRWLTRLLQGEGEDLIG